MTYTYFLTGFPGFIGTRLIKKMVSEHPDARFELLIHPSQLDKALQDVQQLVEQGFGQAEQYMLLAGDITVPQLGLSAEKWHDLQEHVTHVFHLAAIYDLAVPYEFAHRVNVIGTGNVNEFVLSLPYLQRYVYFSTAYVSGDRTGQIWETELEAGQRFKNHYESTKYAAEVLVQKIRNRVPVTIIRPGIVMGDSRTGETAKFDGPYFMMRFLDRFEKFPIPAIGDGKALINLVPVDYIVEATFYLAHAEHAANQVYHLTDPSPYPTSDVLDKISQELLGKKLSWNVPAGLIDAALAIGAFRRWVHVERETIAYFQCLAHYDNSNARRDLAEAGIRCPNLADYLPHAIAFYKEHRHDADKRIPVR
jgi:thioester reductase-like protein